MARNSRPRHYAKPISSQPSAEMFHVEQSELTKMAGQPGFLTDSRAIGEMEPLTTGMGRQEPRADQDKGTDLVMGCWQDIGRHNEDSSFASGFQHGRFSVLPPLFRWMVR